MSGAATSTSSLDTGWIFEREGSEPVAVVLPHDAMLAERRSSDAATGSHGGYFPGGRYIYTRRWTAPNDLGIRCPRLLFEGVQGACEVHLDGVLVGERPHGYDEFWVELMGLTAGTEHEIRVTVDNTAVPTSRLVHGLRDLPSRAPPSRGPCALRP